MPFKHAQNPNVFLAKQPRKCLSIPNKENETRLPRSAQTSSRTHTASCSPANWDSFQES